MKTLASKIIKFLLIIFIVLGVLEFATYFIAFNQYKEVVEKISKEQFNLKVKINGDIRYRLFPLPHIELEKVEIATNQDDLLAKVSKANLYLGMLSLPNSLEQAKFKKLHLNNGEFNLTNILENFKENKLNEKLGLNSFIITNSSIDVLSSTKDKVEKGVLERLNLKLSKDGWFSKNIKLESNFEINHKPLNFTATFDAVDAQGSSDQAMVRLYDKTGEISFAGKLENLISEPKLAGNITAKVTDVEKFSQHFSSSQYIKTLLSKENLSITGEVEASKKYLNIKKLTINSNNIKNIIINSKTEFYPNIESNINVTADNINLDNFALWENKDTATSVKLQEMVYGLLSYFNTEIFNTIDLFFNLKINSLTVNSEFISNLIFDFDSFAGDISLNTFEFKLPGSSGLNLKGIITNNTIRPKFIGDLEFVSNDFPKFLGWLNIDKNNDKLYSFKKFIIKSQAELIPNNFKLVDIKAALDNLLFVGSLSARNGDKEKVSLYTGLRFNKVDGDYFNLDKMLRDLVTKFYISDYDKTGDVYSKNTDDYKWLRKFSGNVNFDITVDEFTLNKYKYNNFDFSLGISPNLLALNKIAAKSEFADFDGRINLSLPSFKPTINLNFNFDSLDTKFLNYVLPSQASLRETLVLHFRNQEKESRSTFSDKKEEDAIVSGFNFFSANNHEGSIELKASKFINDKFNASDVEFLSTLNNGLIIIDKLNAKVFDGQASIRGNVAVLSPVPSVSFSLALYNVNPGKLMESFTGVNNMSGYLSASGSVSSSGMNMPSLVSNMQGSVELLAKKVGIKGFDVGQLVNIPELATPINDKLKRLDYYAKYGESLFDKVKGRIKINNGIASFEDFTLENNRVGGAFAAKYDIYNNVINSIVRFSFIPINRPTPIEFQFTSKGAMSNLTTTRDLAKLTEYVNIRSRSIGNIAADAAEEYNQLDKESVLRKRLK
ncbi:AsmA family protein [Candidatus Jidaibacter acanthamoebae]|uniref:AsmA family protein n=1 Tax=Candidatus Jidaibacter acanthamoebae TaxID=86105 RepID=UPI00057DCE4C|nr:AsmA family protein [Candidatus Jidaibacter acanthamoeba]